jgi:stress-induced morphogen
MTPIELKTRLEVNFPGDSVEVFDLTGTENHYEVNIQSDRFQGMNRIQRHQAVMAVFGPELKTGEVHALSIKAKTKGEP